MTNCRILIVDDETSIRMSVQALLRGAGYSVRAADSIATAREQLSSEAADVVISDILLGDGSGIELLERVREMTPDAEVIMMTGAPTVETAASALRLGAVDYVLKPFGKDSLLHAVRNAIHVKGINDDRRRLEADNQRHRERLEELVKQRTRELRQSNIELSETVEQLRVIQDQVVGQERLNALGQMVSGITHDFNNVLMPIVGLSDCLLNTPAILENREETLYTLRTIHSAAQDARDIVLRLREFYHPDDKPNMTQVDLSSVSRAAIDLTQPKWKQQSEAAGRTIEVRVDIPETLIIDANEHQLREVLCNLIINACDAMNGDGIIEIVAEADGAEVTLTVRDTGQGMSESVRLRCLEPFFTTKGEAGSGLGLSMCHGVIQRHNGRLDIKSVTDQGTAVTIVLPLQQAHTGTSNDEDITPRKIGSALRIGIVDDHPASLLLMTKYVEQAGHHPVAASDGKAFLEMIETEPIDLLITDRAMPGMSGDELATIIKKKLHVPTIMVTGFSELVDRKDKPREHLDLVVPKPVTADDLLHAIEKVWCT